MNWYQHPDTADKLAAAYVLGTLQGPARRRFEALLPKKALLSTAVSDWTRRLAPLLTTLPPQEPSSALWMAIEQRTVGRDSHSPKPESLRRRIFSVIPAGALAMGILVGVLVPNMWQTLQSEDSQAQLPASYVGVLGTADGKPGLVVSSLRHGMWVDIKQLVPVAVPQGKRMYLWRIDVEGKTKLLGTIPSGKWVQMPLQEPAENNFSQAVELAVSLEPADLIPQAPQLPYVYRGFCGKLWK